MRLPTPRVLLASSLRCLVALGAAGCAANVPADDALATADEPATAPLALACAPAPTSPADGAATASPYPNLLWTAGDCAPASIASYRVQIATDSGFTQLFRSGSTYTGRFVHSAAIPAGSYYWRVRAVDASGAAGTWSATRRLTVLPFTQTFTVPDRASRTQIQAVLARALAASGPRRVLFAANGHYDLDCAGTPSGDCLDLRSARDLVVDGQGAIFYVHTPTAGVFAVQNSRDLSVRNVQVDYEPLPYAQARVIAIDPASSPSYIDVELLPGMPDMLAPHMVLNDGDPDFPKWAELLDPSAPGSLSPHSHGIYSGAKVTRLATGRFRITPRELARDAVVGDVFHKQARVNGASTFSAGNSSGFALDGITVYASPGGMCNAPAAHGLVVLNTRTWVRDGRYSSTDADAIHSPGMTLGPWVENTLFWGVMDDVMNLRPPALDVASRSGNTVTLAGSSAVPVGDRVTVYNPVDGTAVTRVVLASRTASGRTVLDLDGAPGAGIFLYAFSQAAPSAVLRFNTVLGGMRYGFLLRTRGAVIDGNVFDRQAGAAIAFENHPWRSDEGLAMEDAWVSNNLVRANRDPQGAIYSAIMKCDAANPAACSRTISLVARAQRRLRYVGNEVQGWTGYAFNLNNGVGGALQCNTVGAPARNARAAIHLAQTDGFTVAHNRLDATGGYPAVQVAGSTLVTQSDNGPMADATLCPLASTRRGANFAPLWP